MKSKALPPALPNETFSGWLSKKSNSKMASVFQKRYFVLTTDALVYAKKPEALEVEGEPTEYPLNELEWVKLCGEEDLCKEFEVAFKQRVLRLRAPDSQNAQQWVSNIEQAAHISEHDQSSTLRGAGKKAAGKQALLHEASNAVAEFDANIQHQQYQGPPAKKQPSPAGSDDDESYCPPPQPAHARKAALYKSLNQTLDLDLDDGPELREEEKATEQRPPSPRSILANPARFGSLMVESPRQPQPSPRKLAAPEEHASVQSWSHPSDSDKDSPMSSKQRLAEPQGTAAAASPRAEPPAALRMADLGRARALGVERPQSAAGRAPLRPRLLQPDAPLPESTPKPGLHHAIISHKVHSSRASSAHSKDEPEEGSEQLQLEPVAARELSRMGGSGGSTPGGGSSRGGSRQRPHDPDSETLVLEGGTEGGGRRPDTAGGTRPWSRASNDGPSSLNSSGGGAARSGGMSKGDHTPPSQASLQSSLHSSIGSARMAAPRLLSGAASRAPPQLDERIELPPPNYPRSPAVPASRPALAPAANGHAQPSSTGQQNDGSINRSEIEENWDSDEEEEGPAALKQQQPQPQHPPPADAKAHFRRRVPQQLQQHKEPEVVTAANSWDDDDNEEEQAHMQARSLAQHKGSGLGATPRPPPRPMPPSASKGPAPHVQVRQQQVLRLQEQQRQQQEAELLPGGAQAHTQQAMSAVVTEDPNWVEENWDSDDE